MSGYKWIPNALSLSRIPFGFAVAVCALENQWIAAFILLAVGLLTDWLDGFFANLLDAKSDFGGKRLDPAGDLVLTVGALWGLVFTETIPWSIVWLLAAILVAIWTPIILKKAENRLHIVCEGLSPFYYLALILSFIIIYAFKAFGNGALWLLIVVVPAAAITIKIKRHRLALWFDMLKNIN